LVSALSERPVPANCVILGEVALSGEIRPVAHLALRLKEAAKLGFERAWIPGGVETGKEIAIERFSNLRGLVERIIGR
jgi:DNA repair protein RadA/Sms